MAESQTRGPCRRSACLFAQLVQLWVRANFHLLQRWWQLPAAERRVALGLLLLLPVIDVSLRILGLQRSWAWLAWWTPAADSVVDSHALAAATRVADLARAVGNRSLWPTSCLRQALAVWLLLRRRHLPAELKIGVTRREPPFQAHAWVDLNGVALDPEAAAHSAFSKLR